MKKAMVNSFIWGMGGLFGVSALNMFGVGIITFNIFTALTAMVLGVPGVIGMLMLKMFTM